MDDLICEMMENSLHKLLGKDEVYQQDSKALSELERKYTEMELTDRQRQLINDYIACLQTTCNRVGDISYLAGIRDTLRLLKYLEL